jgi:hypothetical protein
MQPEESRLLDVSGYLVALEGIRDLTRRFLGAILRRRSDEQPSLQIVANFIARSFVSLESLFALYQRRDFHDCMLLLRTIIDRLLHLGAIAKADAWEDFIVKTASERHRYLNKIRSDREMYAKREASFDEAYAESKRVIAELDSRPVRGGQFSSFRPEELSKELGLKFIYDYGYDHASTYVHPLADEGMQDIGHLMGVSVPERSSDDRTILQNACLSYLLLISHSIHLVEVPHKDAFSAAESHLLHFVGTGRSDHLEAAKNALRATPSAG